MSLVWGYVVFPEDKGPGTDTYFLWEDNPAKAAQMARERAKKTLKGYYAAKVVLTHHVPAPRVITPEIEEMVDADAEQPG